METIQAITLGVIQGLTEFLPVSSSGHLVIFQHLFGLREPELLFDICLHVGTLLAVIIVFYPEIKNIIMTLFRFPSLLKKAGNIGNLYRINEDVRLCFLIIVGSIPTGIIGVIFSRYTDVIFGSIRVVGVVLIFTGILLWLTRLTDGSRKLSKMTSRDAVTIGLVQGVAIIPGISRSGSTIATALLLGIDRKVAGRYSFLLAVPAILGALVLGLDSESMQTSLPVSMILAGTAVSALVGYLALVILLRIVDRGRLYYFTPYCVCAGLLSFIFSF